jgi:hypothetical protein
MCFEPMFSRFALLRIIKHINSNRIELNYRRAVNPTLKASWPINQGVIDTGFSSNWPFSKYSGINLKALQNGISSNHKENLTDRPYSRFMLQYTDKQLDKSATQQLRSCWKSKHFLRILTF